MMWREGFLIKLKKIGIGGRILRWINDFLENISSQVKIGSEVSKIR